MSERLCPRCGEPLPDRANFCPNCGAPVAIPSASERRVVTVVFVDLAGSTELAARLDPERFREVLVAFHGMVSEEIAWLGGVAEGFIGDAVLGVFGVPTGHDDDAVRALRAAMSIDDETERLGRSLGLPMPMRVRIGVNTGRVAVGTATDRNIVIGAEVNIGARLQQAAEPGEILAGETTVQLARGLVDFGPAREVVAKGLASSLIARPVQGFRTRRRERTHVPLVDRRRELTLLEDTFQRVASRKRAHLVTLLGEPGIGKSRVAEEFIERLPEGTTVFVGSSSPYEESITFWPIAQMVTREIGDAGVDDEDAVLAKLRERLSGWIDQEEVDMTARQLALVLGHGEPGSEENRYHAAEVRRGVLTLLSGLAETGPVVLVFEDAHEADPLLLDLIEQLVRGARKLPLMIICVARWDLLDERPSWGGGIPDAVSLWVEPLTLEHATKLAALTGDLDEADAARVARHAGGNPFFVIEVTGMLLHEERDLPPAGPAPSGRLLPATVQAVIASRMDSLSPDARELVRRASVFPRGRFDLDELSLLADPRLIWLDEAADEEILVRDLDRPGVWAFRSDVVRDVAYESLAKRERQRLHLRVADRLSEAGTAERYPRTIAFHLEQAAHAALDLSSGDRALADRAVDALARAGDEARGRVESRAAADLYRRALTLAGPEQGWGDREARILSMLGEAEYWVGRFTEAEESLTRALEVASPENDRVIAHACRSLGDMSLAVRGDDAAAQEMLERALGSARRLADPIVLARTLQVAAWIPFRRGLLDEAASLFDETLEVARSCDRPDAWSESRALAGLSATTSPRGSEEDALALALRSLAVAEGSGQSFTSAIAHEAVAASLRRLDRLTEAEPHADEAVRTLRELGARWELAAALGERGAIRRAAGRFDEAEQDLREAFVMCRDLAERSLVTWTASELARTLAATGDVAGAMSLLEDPEARAAEQEADSAGSLHLAEAAAAYAAGDTDAALARSMDAVRVATEAGSPNPWAAAVWWVASLFGREHADGVAADEARDTLRANGWELALREPDLVRSTAPR